MSVTTRSTVAVLVAMSLLGGACSTDRKTTADEVRRALDATTLVSRSYVYTDVIDGGIETRVEVTIEDDFRYQAVWSVDGSRVYTEVVRDDAIAARADDFDLVMETLGASAAADEALEGLEGLGGLPAPSDSPSTSESAAPTASESTAPSAQPSEKGSEESAPDIDGSAALEAGNWVVDQIGAPAVTTGATVDDLGRDPVLDAVGVLTLATTSVASAPAVSIWDESAIEYDPDEDPFRAPENADDGEDEVAETRYDIAGQPVLSRANVTGGEVGVVTPEMLRQMAIYTKDGLVTEIRLRIGTSAEVAYESIEKAYALPVDGTPEERAARALEAVNQARTERGDAPIVPRDITVTFDAGDAEHTVDLPTGQVASLAILADRGSVDGTIPSEPTDEPSDGSSAGEVPEPLVASDPP